MVHKVSTDSRHNRNLAPLRTPEVRAGLTNGADRPADAHWI